MQASDCCRCPACDLKIEEMVERILARLRAEEARAWKPMIRTGVLHCCLQEVLITNEGNGKSED